MDGDGGQLDPGPARLDIDSNDGACAPCASSTCASKYAAQGMTWSIEIYRKRAAVLRLAAELGGRDIALLHYFHPYTTLIYS